VFFRHLYYLDPPFVESQPENPWLMDPEHLGRPQELLHLLHREDIRWVVKAPNYPRRSRKHFWPSSEKDSCARYLRRKSPHFQGSGFMENERLSKSQLRKLFPSHNCVLLSNKSVQWPA
jgi:hypothetical protein